MEIIDCQIHEPHIGGSLRASIPTDIELSESLETWINVELAREAIDCVGVDRAVVFARPAFNDAAVQRYPELFCAVAVFDYAAADLEAQISAFAARPGMVGCRTLLTNYGKVWRDPEGQLELNPDFKAGAYDRYFALAEQYRLPIFIGGHDFGAEVAPYAEKHPDLTIIVDHYGITQSLARPIEGDRWRALPRLLELARYPNVYVKCCGAPLVSREPYPYRDVWPPLHAILKAFGPGRCMWGSDFTRQRWGTSTPPDDSGFPPRKDWIAYAKALHCLLDSPEISPSDKAELFAGSVRRALKWPAPTSTETPR